MAKNQRKIHAAEIVYYIFIFISYLSRWMPKFISTSSCIQIYH